MGYVIFDKPEFQAIKCCFAVLSVIISTLD
jgi:hypothetical protein